MALTLLSLLLLLLLFFSVFRYSVCVINAFKVLVLDVMSDDVFDVSDVLFTCKKIRSYNTFTAK